MEKARQSSKQTERMGRVRRHGMLRGRGNKWMLAAAMWMVRMAENVQG